MASNYETVIAAEPIEEKKAEKVQKEEGKIEETVPNSSETNTESEEVKGRNDRKRLMAERLVERRIVY